MRRFSSYGPVDTRQHYYAPRTDLIQMAYSRLTGEDSMDWGHYITVWAPRQCGKTWLMQQVLFRLKKEPQFHVLKINLEHLKYESDTAVIISAIAKEIGEGVNKDLSGIDSQSRFQEIFRKEVLEKPIILILDEFDALEEEAIHVIVSTFRNIHIKRRDEMDKTANQRSYLLQGVALIGVRSVLGIENVKGSPFNIQQSLHIPNLTRDEVETMFQWYQKESGQVVEQDVIDRLYYETAGQPGLTCWFGELLTEGFEEHQVDRSQPLDMAAFNRTYSAATYALPNNNILNIISKAKDEASKPLLLELFKTDDKKEFRFDDPMTNALYMNGIIDKEVGEAYRYYIKFASPFVQKRLFNYFSYELFRTLGTLVEPFSDQGHVITETDINIVNLLKQYQTYLHKNRDWLFKDAPRRSDMKLYEAVFHFNIYSYLNEFLRSKGGQVYPEFPTGNGKIDLLISYREKNYGVELKSYTDQAGFTRALSQAAAYGGQLGLDTIFLAVFVERIDDRNRKTFEQESKDSQTGVTVVPVFIETH